MKEHITPDMDFCLVVSRADKMAELNSNFVLKYYLYSNLKGIISVSWNKSFGFSPEATRVRIEQNITNAGFYKA